MSLYSLSWRASYRKISWKPEVARLDVILMAAEVPGDSGWLITEWLWGICSNNWYNVLWLIFRSCRMVYWDTKIIKPKSHQQGKTCQSLLDMKNTRSVDSSIRHVDIWHAWWMFPFQVVDLRSRSHIEMQFFYTLTPSHITIFFFFNYTFYLCIIIVIFYLMYLIH